MSTSGSALGRLSAGTDHAAVPLKRIAVGITAVLVAVGVVYLPTWGTDEIGQMRIKELRGDVVLIRDGETLPIEGETELRPGDRVRSIDAGSAAQLRLAGARHAFVTGKSALLIEDETTLSVASGSVKATARDGDAMILSLDDIDVTPTTPDATFRLDRGFGFARTGVYSGSVRLSRPGERSLDVERLFEASTAGGELPLVTKPYRIDEGDDWDRQHLLEVIELDQNLSATAASLTNQLGRAKPTVGFFSGLAGKRVDFIRSFMKRPTDDLLIGFSVARHAGDLVLSKAFSRAFELRDQGGNWGVVATILEARERPLLAQLGDIVLATGIADGGGRGQDRPDLTLAAASEASGTAPTGPGGGGDPSDPVFIDPGDDPGGEDPGPDPGDDPGGGGDDPGDDLDVEDLVCPPVCPSESPEPKDGKGPDLDLLP